MGVRDRDSHIVWLTIRDSSRRTGLSEPTSRYDKRIKLIGSAARDVDNGHRRYSESVEASSCRWEFSVPGSGISVDQVRGVATTDLALRESDSKLGHVPVISAARARTVRGWRLRPVESTISETAQSLIARGSSVPDDALVSPATDQAPAGRCIELLRQRK